MIQIKEKKGFVPVMLTPFKENGDVDYKALSELTAFYLNAGASGLFANCLSSEMFELSMKERLMIIENIVTQVNGRVPVVATGSFGNSLIENADAIKKIYDKGVTSVILITSLLSEASEPDSLLEDRVFRLLDLTDNIPVGFYECPVPYKRVLPPALLGAFVKTGRVNYHKDTSLDIASIKGKLAACSEKENFGLYDAYIGNAIASLQEGAAGLSCIQGNFFPELIVWLCDHYLDVETQNAAIAVQKFFMDNMYVMHHIYPVVAKYLLRKKGLKINTFSRRQVGIFSRQTSEDLDQLYRDYKDLVNRLNIDLVAAV